MLSYMNKLMQFGISFRSSMVLIAVLIFSNGVTPGFAAVRGARASAIAAFGFVVHVEVTDGGEGYLSPPAITLTGGGGSGAGAVANVTNGAVVSITMVRTGFGYSNAPSVTITPPPGLSIATVPLLTVKAEERHSPKADAVHGKTWAPRGQTPVIERPGQRQTISAASAVSSKGAFWFATYQGGLTGELFVSLLQELMRKRKKSVRLVVDGLPAHKKAIVKEYVAGTEGKLTLHFLPGYAPELNPDELVWSHAKRTGVARSPLKAGEKLECRVEDQLQNMANDTALVRSFFRHPSVRYISDC